MPVPQFNVLDPAGEGGSSSSTPSSGGTSGSSGGTALPAGASGAMPATDSQVVHSVLINVPTPALPINGPDYVLRDNEYLELGPGTQIGGAANAANVQVALGVGAGPLAQFRPQLVFTPTGVPRAIEARRILDVWIFGTAGDGLAITVKRR